MDQLQRIIESNSLLMIKNLGEKSITEIQEKMGNYLLKNDVQQVLAFQSENDIRGFVDSTSLGKEPKSFDKRIIADLPTDLLNSYLSKDQIKQLSDAGFQTIGQLNDVLEKYMLFLLPNEELLEKTIRTVTQRLHRQMLSGTLSANLVVENMSLGKYLQYQPAFFEEKLEYLLTLKKMVIFDSLDEEMDFIFSSLTERQEEYYLKYQLENISLEELSKPEDITRERVRQIISNSRGKIVSNISRIRLDYTISSLAIANQLKGDLSKSSWKSELENRSIVDKQQPDITINRFFAILLDVKLSKYLIPIPDNVFKAIKNTNNYPVFLIDAMTKIPKEKFRQINRIVNYTGGINKLLVEEILQCQPDETAEILEVNNLFEIIPNWFSIKGETKLEKNTPIFRAGLIMMQACGPLDFNSFCGGLRRYVSRHFDAIAPPPVVSHMLSCFGFTIKDNVVSYKGGEVVAVEGSEKLILDLLNEKGLVLSFLEIVEFYLDRGYSFSTATTRVMPNSPVLERIEQGFYKLRGHRVTWQELESVKFRQEEYSKSSEVTYGLDGIINYRVNVGSWALGGVLSISRSSQPLPDFSEGWPVYVDGKKMGIARRDDSLIWGLSQAFNKLNVKLGDRLELSFDTWNEPKVYIRIVEE